MAPRTMGVVVREEGLTTTRRSALITGNKSMMTPSMSSAGPQGVMETTRSTMTGRPHRCHYRYSSAKTLPPQGSKSPLTPMVKDREAIA